MSPLCTGIVHPQAYPPGMFLTCCAIWYRLTRAPCEISWSYICEYVLNEPGFHKNASSILGHVFFDEWMHGGGASKADNLERYPQMCLATIPRRHQVQQGLPKLINVTVPGERLQQCSCFVQRTMMADSIAFSVRGSLSFEKNGHNCIVRQAPCPGYLAATTLCLFGLCQCH